MNDSGFDNYLEIKILDQSKKDMTIKYNWLVFCLLIKCRSNRQIRLMEISKGLI